MLAVLGELLLALLGQIVGDLASLFQLLVLLRQFDDLLLSLKQRHSQRN